MSPTEKTAARMKRELEKAENRRKEVLLRADRATARAAARVGTARATAALRRAERRKQQEKRSAELLSRTRVRVEDARARQAEKDAARRAAGLEVETPMSRAERGRRRAEELTARRAAEFEDAHTIKAEGRSTRKETASRWNDPHANPVNPKGEWEIHTAEETAAMELNDRIQGRARGSADTRNTEGVVMARSSQRVQPAPRSPPPSPSPPSPSPPRSAHAAAASAASSATPGTGTPEVTAATTAAGTPVADATARKSPKVPVTATGMRRVAVVTGASGAIGTQICMGLVREGVTVVPTCRSEAKCRSLRDKIVTAQESAGNVGGEVFILPRALVDVASADSVREFSVELRSRFPDGLALLVNAAAVASLRRQEVSYVPRHGTGGKQLEMQFATNVMGYFHTMHHLGPLLETWGQQSLSKGGGPARIVNLSSTFAGYLDLSDLQFSRRMYSSGSAYQQSKQGDRMLTWAAAAKYARKALSGSEPGQQAVVAHACHPGIVPSALSAALGFGVASESRAATLQAETASGAPLYLALSDDAEVVSPGPTGGWWWEASPGEVVPKRKACRYASKDRLPAAEELWAYCKGLHDAALNAGAGDL